MLANTVCPTGSWGRVGCCLKGENTEMVKGVWEPKKWNLTNPHAVKLRRNLG